MLSSHHFGKNFISWYAINRQCGIKLLPLVVTRIHIPYWLRLVWHTGHYISAKPAQIRGGMAIVAIIVPATRSRARSKKGTPLPGLFLFVGWKHDCSSLPPSTATFHKETNGSYFRSKNSMQKIKSRQKKKKICWGNSSVTSHPLFYLTAKTTLSQVQSLFHHDHICTAKSFLIWLCSTDLSLFNIGIG